MAHMASRQAGGQRMQDTETPKLGVVAAGQPSGKRYRPLARVTMASHFSLGEDRTMLFWGDLHSRLIWAYSSKWYKPSA